MMQKRKKDGLDTLRWFLIAAIALLALALIFTIIAEVGRANAATSRDPYWSHTRMGQTLKTVEKILHTDGHVKVRTSDRMVKGYRSQGFRVRATYERDNSRWLMVDRAVARMSSSGA